MAGLPRALTPLRYRRYRLLAASLGFSLLTNSTLAVAVVGQVVALGGGPAELSLVSGLQAGGMLASTLLGGALADRVPQRHILLAVALAQTLGTALVAALSLAGVLTLWQLAAVGLAGGLANGLYYPAYSALVPALLPEDSLLAANGLEGTMRPVPFQAAGPAVAAGVVAATSPGVALAVTPPRRSRPRSAWRSCRRRRSAGNRSRRPRTRCAACSWTWPRAPGTWSARPGCSPLWSSPR
ncbi:MFS transporter [Geodermatophilus sp. SYSU D00703]